MEELYRSVIAHFDFKKMRALPIYLWNWDATGSWSMPEVLRRINNVWNKKYSVANYENTNDRSKNAQCALYLIGHVIYKRLYCTTYPDGYHPGKGENFPVAEKIRYKDHCDMTDVAERHWGRKKIQEGNIDRYVARIQYETGIPLNSLSNESICRDSKRYFRKFLDARYSEKDLYEWSTQNLPHGTGTQSSIFFNTCMDLFRHGNFDGEIYDFDGLKSYLTNSGYPFQGVDGFLDNLRGESQRNMAWQPDYSVYFNRDCFYVDFTPKNKINDFSTTCIEVLDEKNDVLKDFPYQNYFVKGNPLKKYPISEYTSYRRRFMDDNGKELEGNSRTFLPKNRTWILKKKNDSFELCRGAKLPTEDSFPVYVFPPHGLETDIPQKYEITISQLDISRQGYKFDSLQEFDAYREKLIEEVPEYKEVEYKFNVWSDSLHDFVDKICSGFYSVPSWARWRNSQNGTLEDIPQYVSSTPQIGKIARNGDDKGRKSLCIVPNGFKYEFIKNNHGQYSEISLSYEDGNINPKRITDKNGYDLDFSNLKVHDIIRCQFEDYRIDILSPVPGLSWTFGKDCSFVENNKEYIAFNCMSFAELALIPSLTNPPKEIGEGLVEFNLKLTLYAWNKAQAGYCFKANLKKGKKISTDTWLYSTNLVAYKSYVASLLASVDDLKAYVEVSATFDSREEKIYICRSEPLIRRIDQNNFVYFSILKADIRKQKPTYDDLVNDIWIKVPVTDLSDRWQWDGRYRIEKINDFSGNANCLTNLQRILASNDNAWERLSNYLWADTRLSDADYELLKKYHDLNVNHKVPLCNLWLFQAVFHNDKLCSELYSGLDGLLGSEIMNNAMKYPFEPELMRPNHHLNEYKQNDIPLQEKILAKPDFYDENGESTNCEYAIDSIVRLTEIGTSDKDYRRNHSKCVVYFRQLSQIKSRQELLSEISNRRNYIKLELVFQNFKGLIPEEKILSCIATGNVNQTTLTDAVKKHIVNKLSRMNLWNKSVYEGINTENKNPYINLNGFFECPAKMLEDPTLSNEKIKERAQKWGKDIARVLNYCRIDEALDDCDRSMKKIQLDCPDKWRHLLPLQDNGLLGYDLNRDEYKREVFRSDLIRNVVKRIIEDGLSMSFDFRMDAESFSNMVNGLLQKNIHYDDLFEKLIIQCRDSYIENDKDFKYWEKTFKRLIIKYGKNGSPRSYKFEYIFCTREELDKKIERMVNLMPTRGR